MKMLIPHDLEVSTKMCDDTTSGGRVMHVGAFGLERCLLPPADVPCGALWDVMEGEGVVQIVKGSGKRCQDGTCNLYTMVEHSQ